MLLKIFPVHWKIFLSFQSTNYYQKYVNMFSEHMVCFKRNGLFQTIWFGNIFLVSNLYSVKTNNFFQLTGNIFSIIPINDFIKNVRSQQKFSHQTIFQCEVGSFTSLPVHKNCVISLAKVIDL